MDREEMLVRDAKQTWMVGRIQPRTQLTGCDAGRNIGKECAGMKTKEIARGMS